jgi:hypothetical protein
MVKENTITSTPTLTHQGGGIIGHPASRLHGIASLIIQVIILSAD